MISDNHVVICQTRSILDTLASFVDYYDKGDVLNPFSVNADGYWSSLSFNDKVDELIEYYLPWHVLYLQSWLRVSDQANVKLLKFEDVIVDPWKSFDSVFSSYTNTDRMGDGGGLEGIKFNKGVSGRGAEMLSQRDIDRVVDKVKRLDKFNMSLQDYI